MKRERLRDLVGTADTAYRRSPVCESLSHPRAQGGPIVKVGRLTYMDLVCTVCGRPQGRRLIRRKADR